LVAKVAFHIVRTKGHRSNFIKMNFDELARCPIPRLFDNMLVGLESVLEMV
jgi:hypothetical protein